MTKSLHIHKTRCDECGTCLAVCPHRALVLTKSIVVDDSRCVRCATCIKVCPVGALSLEDAKS